MGKQYAFYITNHGFGHASRNVRIIEGILEREPTTIIHIKSDRIRCEFLQRNLKGYKNSIIYHTNIHDIGFLLKGRELEVDVQRMRMMVEQDERNWPDYIEYEQRFLTENNIDGVVSDIIAWALIAAKRCKIPSVMLCNFTWYEMYSDFLEEYLCLPYLKAYQQAGKIFLYEFGAKTIEKYNANVERVSFVARKINQAHVERIRKEYQHPLVFVSVGKSIEMSEKFDVSDINATFLITAGVELEGKNVIRLPEDLISTQDYITASDYILTKGGWSTLGEIFLNRKRAAIIVRGKNSEDMAVMKAIGEHKTGVNITFKDLKNVDSVLKRMDRIDIRNLERYTDDSEKIVDYIISMGQEEHE